MEIRTFITEDDADDPHFIDPENGEHVICSWAIRKYFSVDGATSLTTILSTEPILDSVHLRKKQGMIIVMDNTTAVPTTHRIIEYLSRFPSNNIYWSLEGPDGNFKKVKL